MKKRCFLPNFAPQKISTRMRQPLLSILISTYNRAAILSECLDSLTQQSAAPAAFEVLVINNNATDHTLQVAESFLGKVPNLRIFTETQQGLCFARNRAYREAAADWVLYLDDDAKASPNMVERALNTIQQHPQYRVFGGVALPWYKYGKPHWYLDRYVATNQLPYKKVSPLRGNQFAIGCIMIYHRPTLEAYGGFSEELGGMTGDKIVWNDEVELQLRMRRQGVPMAHDPELFIQHLVPTYKLSVDWFFKAAFAQGRDNVKAKNVNPHPLNLLIITIVALSMMFVHLMIYSPQLLKKTYYIENWLIDVFRKVAKRVGTVYTILLEKGKNMQA
jgi:glycosyltransferase involved in cell wall biosynthesis